MKPLQHIEHDIQEVASLLIPLHHKSLLVPNVTVAEIIPITAVVPVNDAPDWYLGNCEWREQIIPLLSFELLNGDELGDFNSSARFAVFNTTGLNELLPFIAIVTQGIPRLARVNQEEITTLDIDKKPFELLPVTWAGEEAVIPNIRAIETKFLDYLNTP
jgi:chemosensory pili system protein ChpC